MSQITKLIVSLTLGVILLNPIAAGAFQGRRSKEQRPVAQRRAQTRKDPARERREKTFQLVWQTVKDQHFDPTFGGVDWDAVRIRYAPLVATVKSDQELHNLLQVMINELPQSHFTIIPPERIPRIKSKRTLPHEVDGKDGEETELLNDVGAENESDNDIATRMMNGIGIDVRILNGQVTITRVVTDGPAAKAGLRPGLVIKSIDDISLENIARGANPGMTISPIIHMRLRQRILVDYIGGEPGSDVHLLYLDEQNREQQAVIKRERLSGALSSSVGNLPPLYTEFETQRLAGEIGYLRFSVFTPLVTEKICGAIKSMRNATGLIIDLRGNPGGVMGMASGIVGLLTNKAGLIGVLRMRKGQLPIPAFPQRSRYSGPLVVLIDRLSASTAEVMTAVLQESGRAVIVGERSAGVVLGADIIKLPTGALFEYARTGFVTPGGTTLEGKGVTPDVERQLSRTSLLRGQDDQLQEAIRQIELKKESAKSYTPPPPSVPVEANSNPSPPAPVEGKLPVRGKEINPPGGSHTFRSTPQAEAIMERYIKAVGGRDALERLKNRVSTGVCSLPFQGLTGKVAIYEEAPDKGSMEMDIPNMGVMKIVFDGKRAWMHHPLMGFVEFEEPLVSLFRREYDFHRITRYRELSAAIDYKGIRDTAEGRVDVIQLTSSEGYTEEMLFDVRTGLMVYDGGTWLGDYRQVGEVKVPFSMRMSVAGLDIAMQLEQVSHNTIVKADAFTEPQSCFTER